MGRLRPGLEQSAFEECLPHFFHADVLQGPEQGSAALEVAHSLLVLDHPHQQALVELAKVPGLATAGVERAS